MERTIDLRDYVRQRDLQFRPQIGERYFDLLIRYACRLGQVERSTLLSILHKLGWTEKTLDYHARLVRDCDDAVKERMHQSFERLDMLASAFGLHDWFDDKFPVPRPSSESGSRVIRTSVSFEVDPWKPGTTRIRRN